METKIKKEEKLISYLYL